MLKSYGWEWAVGYVGVSSRVCWWPMWFWCQPKVQILFFFFGGLLFNLGACWDQDLDQGLTIIFPLAPVMTSCGHMTDAFTFELLSQRFIYFPNDTYIKVYIEYLILVSNKPDQKFDRSASLCCSGAMCMCWDWICSNIVLQYEVVIVVLKWCSYNI